jgi:hypothetical protein
MDSSEDKTRWREVMTNGKTRRPNGESGARALIAALQQTSALTSTPKHASKLFQEDERINDIVMKMTRRQCRLSHILAMTAEHQHAPGSLLSLKSCCREWKPQ